MAFGSIKSTWQANNASIPASFAAALSTGTGAVAVGDLVVVVVGEQTGNTSTAVNDSLGHAYTAQNAGTISGTVSGRAYYRRITTAGTLTSITATCTGSGNNGVICAVVIEGPFLATPIDKNPANATDNATPFTCTTTGTLTQANEVVVAWSSSTGSAVWTATAPNTLRIQQASAAILSVRIGTQTTAATTAVAPEFAGTNPTTNVLGTMSFMQAPAHPSGWQRGNDITRAAARVWPALLLATQATSFAVPAPVVASAEVPSGWQSQASRAPAVAKACPTQTTSFAVPPPPDNNTTSKAWHQPLSKPVPVAKAQQGSTFVPFNTAQVLADTPRGWQRDLSTAPRRAVIANTSALTFVAAPFTVPRGWEGQPSVAPKLARVSASVLVGPLYPAAINNNTDAKGWYPPLAGAPKPVKANPTQATSFQTPEQSSVVDNNTEAKGWFPPLAGAPKTAQPQHTQATSFQTPEQSEVVADTVIPLPLYQDTSATYTFPVYYQALIYPVPLDTPQIVVSPQTVPLIQDSSAVYDRPVYYQATIAPPAYIAPSNNVTSLTWQQPLSGAPKTARAVHTSPAFVARPFPQFSLAWQQPLSRAVPVATAQQGWTFVPLNTAQTPPAGIEGMAWHLPLGIVAARLLAAPQGWTFVPFDTVQVEPPPPEFDIPPVPDSGGTGLKTGTDRLRGGTKRDPAAYAQLRKVVKGEIKPDPRAIEQARLEAEAQAKLAKEQLAAAAPLSTLVEKTTAEQPTIEPPTDDEEAIAILLLS